MARRISARPRTSRVSRRCRMSASACRSRAPSASSSSRPTRTAASAATASGSTSTRPMSNSSATRQDSRRSRSCTAGCRAPSCRRSRSSACWSTTERRPAAPIAPGKRNGLGYRCDVIAQPIERRRAPARRNQVMRIALMRYGIASALAAALALLAPAAGAQPAAAPAVAIDDDDIGGVVRGPGGPEAGVWVIAETSELPTKFAKIVVTDEQGRFVIPDLPPKVNYEVWVRGYGLVDSPKLRAKPGQQLSLTAVPAPNETAAAHYLPAIYWFTMMKLPPAKDFGGSSDIPKEITPEIWRQRMNNVDCVGCHQLGQEATRTIPAAFGEFKSGEEAWMRRVASGQTGEWMVNRLAGQLGGVPFKYFGDWTDRVAKGELPKSKPARPSGIERNVVISSWEWATEKHFVHDLISSDRRNPTVNAYGPLFGSNEYSSDDMPILDPKTHKVSFFKMPVADPKMPEMFGPPLHPNATLKPVGASAYWGDEKIWSQRANNHNGMLDHKGRVWFAASVRGIDNPAFCRKDSDHPSAKAFPLERSGRQASMLDPKTMKYSFIDTCFGTHHPQFGYDADNTLWF